MSATDREIEDLEYGRVKPKLYVEPRSAPQVGDDLPDLDVLSVSQHNDAVKRLHEDKSGYARFERLESVHAMTGAFAPEEVVIIAADTEDGKSLLCQNLFDDLTDKQEKSTLYIGTEQSAEVLKIKHACIRAGVRAKLMIKPEKEEIGTEAYEEAVEAVERELDFINIELRGLAFYANTEYVNRSELLKWITGGVKRYGIETVIIDHIDQMEHGEGRNSAHELTATVQLIHKLAKLHKMPIIVASQIKRDRDPIRRHSPPDKHDLAGAAGKERIMAIGLGLWRPLRTDLSLEDLRALKKKASTGGIGQDKIYQLNTMGVRLLKDRLGDVPGKQCFLHVGHGGRLSDDPATTHGIRTGGLS